MTRTLFRGAEPSRRSVQPPRTRRGGEALPGDMQRDDRTGRPWRIHDRARPFRGRRRVLQAEERRRACRGNRLGSIRSQCRLGATSEARRRRSVARSSCGGAHSSAQDVGVLASIGASQSVCAGRRRHPSSRRRVCCPVERSRGARIVTAIRHARRARPARRGEALVSPIIPTSVTHCRSALAVEADMILISGGSSVGQRITRRACWRRSASCALRRACVRSAEGRLPSRCRPRPVFLMAGQSCRVCAPTIFSRRGVRKLATLTQQPYRQATLPLARNRLGSWSSRLRAGDRARMVKWNRSPPVGHRSSRRRRGRMGRARGARQRRHARRWCGVSVRLKGNTFSRERSASAAALAERSG